MLALCAPVLASCGAEQAAPRELLDSQPPARMEPLRYPAVGLRFSAPTNWTREDGELPRVVTLTSGDALVAIWAYRRRQPLPSDAGELRAARRRLVAEVRRRDRDFVLEKSGSLRVDRARAVELVGRQRIAGRGFRTRSVHVFRGRAEYVFEALAPPGEFSLANRRVLDSLLRSLSASGRIR